MRATVYARVSTHDQQTIGLNPQTSEVAAVTHG
jgi:DNA invertase Pin-like site-specific DNA recombinase